MKNADCTCRPRKNCLSYNEVIVSSIHAHCGTYKLRKERPFKSDNIAVYSTAHPLFAMFLSFSRVHSVAEGLRSFYCDNRYTAQRCMIIVGSISHNFPLFAESFIVKHRTKKKMAH